LGVGLTTLPCKKENCWEASKKFSRILWRRPRPRLGCEAKEKKGGGGQCKADLFVTMRNLSVPQQEVLE